MAKTIRTFSAQPKHEGYNFQTATQFKFKFCFLHSAFMWYWSLEPQDGNLNVPPIYDKYLLISVDMALVNLHNTEQHRVE